MTNRDRPLLIPYTQIPHGLWTADLTPKATLLLGWLHSHADYYMDKLTLNRIGKEFGGGRTSATTLVNRLADAGYVTIEHGANGYASHVTLLSAPWEALTRGHAPAEDTPLTSDDAPPCTLVGQVPALPEGTIEEHLDDQPRTPPEEDHAAATFGAFWDRYPRKVGRKDALKAWTRMTKEQRVAAVEVIDSHTAMWVAEGRGTAHVPHGATWLNRESWEDEVGFVATRDVRQVATRATRNADAIQRFADRHNIDADGDTSMTQMFNPRKEIQ